MNASVAPLVVLANRRLWGLDGWHESGGMVRLILAALTLARLLASPPPVTYEFRVVKSNPTTAPHSLGLEHRDGFLYEGTGLAGRSATSKGQA